MFDNLTNDPTIPDHTPDLLGQRTFLVVIVLRLPRHIHVDAGALAREDLRAQTLLAQVDGGAIDLIEHDGGQSAEHLEGKLRTFDDVDGGDEGVDDQRHGTAVVERDRVGFVVDADGGLGAA